MLWTLVNFFVRRRVIQVASFFGLGNFKYEYGQAYVETLLAGRPIFQLKTEAVGGFVFALPLGG